MGKIRVRHGENEIEIEGGDAFVKKQLESFYERIRITARVSAPATLKRDIQAASAKKSGKVPTPAEFFKSKKREDGVSKILIFGQYLEEYRGQSEFTPQNINAIVKEARIGKDIHAQYFTNAGKQGLLRSLGGGKYSLTLSAEEALSAMQ